MFTIYTYTENTHMNVHIFMYINVLNIFTNIYIQREIANIHMHTSWLKYAKIGLS